MIGLGVTGENLALNVSDHAFHVALWDRTERTEAIVDGHQDAGGVCRRRREVIVPPEDDI